MTRPAALLVLALVSCRAASPAYVPQPGPYDVLPAAVFAEAALARISAEQGHLERARERLARLAAEHPEHIPLGAFLQEVELELRARSHGGENGPVDARGADPREAARAALFERALERAQGRDRAADWVLAARLAPDRTRQRELLDQAGARDPRCVWVPYARAFASYAERDFRSARERLVDALSIDAGHGPSRRLQARMLAGAGDTARAAAILRVWLGFAADDPFVDPRERREAHIDLAALLTVEGEPGQALRELDGIAEGAELDPVLAARSWLVRAAALSDRGQRNEALAAARRAAELAPDALLPLVQEARLVAGDAVSESEAWTRLLERARRRGEEGVAIEPIHFQDLLFQLQAHTRMERLAAEQAAEQPQP